MWTRGSNEHPISVDGYRGAESISRLHRRACQLSDYLPLATGGIESQDENRAARLAVSRRAHQRQVAENIHRESESVTLRTLTGRDLRTSGSPSHLATFEYVHRSSPRIGSGRADDQYVATRGKSIAETVTWFGAGAADNLMLVPRPVVGESEGVNGSGMRCRRGEERKFSGASHENRSTRQSNRRCECGH